MKSEIVIGLAGLAIAAIALKKPAADQTQTVTDSAGTQTFSTVQSGVDLLNNLWRIHALPVLPATDVNAAAFRPFAGVTPIANSQATVDQQAAAEAQINVNDPSLFVRYAAYDNYLNTDPLNRLTPAQFYAAQGWTT
jgi:hypothetical protein